MGRGQPWSHDELLVAMNLYCKLPFGRLHHRNPQIKTLAAALGRTPSSIAMKLVNFASLDPAHAARGIKGLQAVSKSDRQVWDEFHDDWNSMVDESENLLVNLAPDLMADRLEIADEPIETKKSPVVTIPEFKGPTESKATVKTRLAQAFFRRAVLAAYGGRCCITGNPVPELLAASHILPWSTHPEQRANPRNGLCLAKTQDAAFDRGLITLDSELRVVVSSELRRRADEPSVVRSILEYAGKPIVMPERFAPDRSSVEYHRNVVFRA